MSVNALEVLEYANGDSGVLDGRVTVDQKQMINCRADLNQLVPIKYNWAWEKYNKANANHWLPQEIPMGEDVALWKSDEVTEQERKIVKQNLGFFSTADSLVANNIVLAVYRLITNPECRQYLLRQAYEEGIHTEAYQYIVESLGLDGGEIYNMYREISSVEAKASFVFKFTSNISDPSFNTGTDAKDLAFLYDLIAYYLVLEGIFFYCGFAQILSMQQRNMFTGIAQQFQLILRDESMHLNFGVDAINQIIQENPHLWINEVKEVAREIVKAGTELEIDYARDTMADGIVGLSFEDMEEYLKYTANKRLKSIGLEPEYRGVGNSLPWMSEIIDMPKEKNFFETRVTDYSTGGALVWDE